MKLKEKILTILFLGIILFSCQKSEKKDDLIVYLKENGKSPTDYVIEINLTLMIMFLLVNIIELNMMLI